MTTNHRFRMLLIGLFALSALALAPAAMARSHSYGSVSISGPGYSVGYSDCRHCGYHGSHVSVGVYGGYAPAYYGPAYYDYYDSYPSTYVVYDRPVRRVRYYEHDRHYDRHRHYHRDGYR